MKFSTRFINPITIIAVFAALAEASATSVLPYLGEHDRKIYIWFLIAFPSALVVMFFLTINFNHKALFPPSDHKDKDTIPPIDQGHKHIHFTEDRHARPKRKTP